jgi:YVTN family beta-propeller protein
MQLPAAAQKVAEDSKQVYVWTNDGDLLAYPVNDKGPMQPALHLALNDPAAAQAASHPPSTIRSAASVRPSTAVTLTPQRLMVANYGNDSVSAIDTSTNTVVGTLALPVNSGPAATSTRRLAPRTAWTKAFRLLTREPSPTPASSPDTIPRR